MNQENLDSIRHSAAHMLAAAVLELYPGTKLGIGPTIEDGFYYDFLFPAGQVVSESDLEQIETKMKSIIKGHHNFVGRKVSAAEAEAEEKDQPFKLELIREFAGEDKELTIYESGPFKDLCRGGHVNNTKEIPADALKLHRVAGAYWRGDEKNATLTRIYGLLFSTKEELDSHLLRLEEAKKRDHRKLGAELDLFTFSDLVGPGLALWTPKGTLLRNTLDDFVQQLRKERGYEKVSIPHITKKELYEKSGHWDKFKNDLFKITTREGHEFAMKPMNCPHHTQIYNHIARSYRDLPQRYAETTMCYRDEQSGELHGLSRVRGFTQDDAHVFCRESQVKEEMFRIWDIIEIFYKAVGFNELRVRLSLHDPAKFENYLGTKEVWESTEKQLRELVKERGVEAFEAIGEAAMYGPKIDFMAKDSIGRQWQVATIQIDRNQPERFDLVCTNEQGEKERIVMVHAAIMGSIERFLSILIEHHAGAFPVWVSPVQVHLAPVSSKHVDGARLLLKELSDAGIRVGIDEADETMGNKVRKAVGQKIPYIVVVGDKELGGEPWMIRVRGEKDQIKMTKEEFVQKVLEEIKERKY
ncbi:MAG: threonine--tRNA ligase [Candidatus Magasanikbacteria bacterium RIFOXYD2_FULL_39_9]|uniref:Threonine--tRNA ligase n=1 Tax=Candidatus Magasanikbacteria bacterium RIFOXYD1_FULL_40_23 TaxID=1798705 RepID=A0A1F6PAF3_9BACT|nr:MAG: threonine--tRNA ligase [Candidatus Magasanikbacteria bacterium RIFOXYD2_FULL_39_9]OGH93098.1 MAG: threonine--tRNA ligase [Candidatus Magasanikbacteria bacterium RIFOXYD1_FULL_40_23]